MFLSLACYRPITRCALTLIQLNPIFIIIVFILVTSRALCDVSV